MTQKTTSLILLFSLLINLFLEKASGHSTDASSSGGVGGPIFTLFPETLAKESWSLNLQTQYQLFNSWSDAQLQANTAAASDSHVHSIDSLSITTIAVSYGWLEDVTLLAQLPYSILSNIREFEDGEIQNHGNSKGLGDLNLSTKWQAWKDPQNGRAFAFLLGTTLPTGQTHIKDNQGNRFETEHQPGSGAVNPYIGTVFSQQFGCGTGFYASVQYQKTFKGAQETRLGDVLNYDVGVVYRLWGEGIPKPLPSSPHHKQNNESSIQNNPLPATRSKPALNDHNHSHDHHTPSQDPSQLRSAVALDAVLELNSIYNKKVKVKDIYRLNTGGNITFLSPGLTLTANALSFSLSIGVPIFQHLNGKQVRFGPRFLLGGSYSW